MIVHFIAIGGSVMHQLAIALKLKGYHVTGSDDEIFEPARSNLRKNDLLPTRMGWFEENIHDSIDSIILGMHAREDNPELIKAKELGLKIYSFPEYIFEESKNKLRVAIGGSHGKTSTTAMIMHVLKGAGKKFDYLVGAQLEGFEQSVHITDAPVIICEADEYPASAIEKRPKFHFLFPNIAVITGIAWDHINVFPTFDFYLEQFLVFIHKIEPGGLLIFNNLDEVLVKLINDNRRSDIRYEPYQLPTYFIEDGITEVIIESHKIALKVFGNHNLLNLQAAWLVCNELGIESIEFTKHIATFAGASKRLQLLAANDQANVYRDFAHAPSKVKATIEALSQQFPERKLIAVLELHTYSSLNAAFMTEYRDVMDNADISAVFYSAHALEIKRLPQLDPEIVKMGFNSPGLEVFTARETLENWLGQLDYSRSNLLLMSSGTFADMDITAFLEKVANKQHINKQGG